MSATINSLAPTPAHRADFSDGFDPTTVVNGNAALTWPNAARSYSIVNSPTPVTITLPSGAIPIGAKIHGLNVGAGNVSFATSSGEAFEADAILPATVGQWSPFELRRTPGNVWVRVA